LKSEENERFQIQNRLIRKETELEGLVNKWTEQKSEMQALQKSLVKNLKTLLSEF